MSGHSRESRRRSRAAGVLFCAAFAATSCGRAPRPAFALRLGAQASAQGETQVALNPVSSFVGLRRQDIYDLRAREVGRHPELFAGDYKPDERVFGRIEDGKPWWGLEGIYFYGPGVKSIEGLSEESRFVSNPFLLVGLRETVTPQDLRPDGSTGYYPEPTSLTWDASGSAARAVYLVSPHFDYTANFHYPPELAHELQFVLYNADDLGFKYFALDSAASSGVRQEKGAGAPSPMRQYIHCGPSCGYPGACNNMSPFSREFDIQVPEVPAKAVLKLWKAEPASASAAADMTFTIDML